MHYLLFQEYKSATKKSNICRKYRHISICINNTQLTTFYCYNATNSITNFTNKQLLFTKFQRGYHPRFYLIPTLPSSLQKKPYTSPFTDVQRIILGSAMHIKGLFSKSMHSTIKLTNLEKLNENYDCKISKSPKQFWEGSEIQFLILFFTLLLHI